MTFDVATAIDAESVPAVYQAPEGGSYDKGNWIVHPAAKSSISAAIQPVSGKVLQDLPEGLQPDVSCVGWSRTAVQLNGLIKVWGRTYRILFVWPRPQDGFNKFALSEKLEVRS